MKFLTELIHLSAVKEDFIKDLLNSQITVSIKIDTSAFVIMNDGDRPRFFGREGKSEIDLDKRAVNAMYEKFIAHVLEKDKWKSLPKGYKVYTELFLPNLPSIVKYTSEPKNGLIISYMTDPNGKILKPDDPEVKRAANVLDIGHPAVIFSGRLNQSGKDELKKYLDTGYHGKSSFLEFVFSLFTPPEDLKWLVKDGFEGVVLYFGNSNEPFMAKLVDPEFTSAIIDKKNDSDGSYYMQLANLVWGNLRPILPWIKVTISNVASGKKKLSGATPFLQVCGAIAGELVRTKGQMFAKELSEFEEEVIGARFFQLAPNLVPKGILSLSSKFWFAQDVFSILVNGLRNMKTRVNPKTGLDATRKDLINAIVTMIDAEGIGRSGTNSESKRITESSFGKLTIIGGRFQPFHLGHMKMASLGSGKPTYVVIKGAKSSEDRDKNPFNAEDQIRWIKKVYGQKANVMVAPNGFLPDIIKSAEEKFGGSVVDVIAGPDRMAGYKRQLNSAPELTDRVKLIPVLDRFEVGGDSISATKVRDAIRSHDIEKFRRLMPAALHDEFNKMQDRLGLYAEESLCSLLDDE